VRGDFYLRFLAAAGLTIVELPLPDPVVRDAGNTLEFGQTDVVYTTVYGTIDLAQVWWRTDLVGVVPARNILQGILTIRPGMPVVVTQITLRGPFLKTPWVVLVGPVGFKKDPGYPYPEPERVLGGPTTPEWIPLPPDQFAENVKQVVREPIKDSDFCKNCLNKNPYYNGHKPGCTR
jgi:hypothetical protein